MAHEWRNCFKMCKIASTFDAPSSVTSMPVCPSLDPAGPWCACRPRDINLIRHDDGSTDAWAACQSPQPRLMRQTTAAANARMMTAAAVCTSEVQSKNWHWRRTDAVSACVFLSSLTTMKSGYRWQKNRATLAQALRGFCTAKQSLIVGIHCLSCYLVSVICIRN